MNKIKTKIKFKKSKNYEIKEKVGHEYTGEWAAMILAAGSISYKCFSILYSTEKHKENIMKRKVGP